MPKQDIRNQPAYTLAEAARYLKVAPATLRSWVVGRSYERTGGTAQSSPSHHTIWRSRIASLATE